MILDLSLLSEKQQKQMKKLYDNHILNNNKKQLHNSSERLANKISIIDFQKLLFEQRNIEGDIYMDIDFSKFNEYLHYDEESGYIVRTNNNNQIEKIKKFESTDFIPSCSHLSDEVIEELNNQVNYSTGGNYSDWSSIHNESKQYTDSLLGYHTLENGLTFYGMYGTNDGVWSVFYILYYDEKNNIKGYIPKEGNQYCKLSNEAWSSDYSTIDNYDEFEEELQNKIDNGTYFDYKSIKQDIIKTFKIK